MSGRQAGPLLIPSTAARNDWRYRAILATRGNQTQLGAVLIAVLGKSLEHGPPRYARQALITKDGVLAAGYQDRTGHTHVLVGIDLIANFLDDWRRLADKIKATDAERTTMFAELRKWVARDDRAVPNKLE